MKLNIKQKVQTYSSEYTFLHSDYDWLNNDASNKFTIQSLLVSATFFNLEHDLKILNQLNEYKDLGFELLVQREINKSRVEIEIVDNYLSMDGKINFFPPIVVALIPSYNHIQNNSFETSFHFNGDSLELNIGKDSIQQTFITNGSLENKLEDYQNFFSSKEIKYGNLKWDKEKFNAIIIDGQHRFYALKTYLKKVKGLELSKCFFPVNFVVVTPKPKVSIEAKQYIKTSRELFIDINKNAKSVSHTRQILLDDLDLLRYITRNSIKQYNITEADTLFDWSNSFSKSHLSKIPQAIVNWNTDIDRRDKENIKLFKFAQVTSTSLLYKILQDFIMRPIDKSEHNNIFEVFYRVFELRSYIPVDDYDKEIIEKIKSKRKRFEEQLKDINDEKEDAKKDSGDLEFIDGEYFNRKITILNEKALSFKLPINLWLSDWFYKETRYGKMFTTFFTRFEPYNKIIKKIEPFFNDRNQYHQIINFLIDPEFRNKSKFKKQITNDKIEDEFSSLFDEIESLKSSSTDVRYTIFQRAIFADIHKIFDLLDVLFPNDKDEERIAKYIDALSSLYKKGILKKGLTVKFGKKPLFKDSVVGDFQLKETYVWTNVWITDNESTIKYRDIDAFKIADLIRIFIVAELTQSNIDKLPKDIFNRISPSLTQIRNLYRTAYIKAIKNHYDLNNMKDAGHKTDTGKFDKDLVSIIEKAIDTYIII